MLVFSNSSVFANNIWIKKVRGKMLRAIAFLASRHIETLHFKPERSIWKFGLRSGQMVCPDEWTKYAMLHISRCVMPRQTQCHLAHGSNSILLPVIDVNVFVACDNVTYGAIWSVQGSEASSCTSFITELHLNRHGYLDLSWLLKKRNIHDR